MQDRRGRSVTGCLHQLAGNHWGFCGQGNAHVAQLDNGPDYGSGRWRFESFRARQLLTPSFYLGTVRVRVLPRVPSLQYVHVAQWTRAEASEASGCAFESRRGLHFDNDMSTNGELAERQGTAVLTRRDLRVGQVRLLHSPPSLTHLFLDDHDAITHGSLRLVARIAAFQAAEDGSKPSGSTNRSPFVQRQDAAL